MLLLALVVILIGAETFTNALEHVGNRLEISEGVTESILQPSPANKPRYVG